jgi:hypothetical protein
MNAKTPGPLRRWIDCALRYRRQDDELLLTLLTFFLCYLLSPR